MNAFQTIQPSFFEMTVAMAFQYFVDRNVDIAIIEVGMGGRLDSTNVVCPELSIITNIDFDHVQFLGNTLPLIAKEKAGIIKNNIPVLIGETHPETEIVFKDIANQLNAPISFADKHYVVRNPKRFQRGNIPLISFDVYKNNEIYLTHVVSALTGIYQEKNFAAIVAAFDILAQKWNLTVSDLKKGIRNCIQNTRLQGRWQRLQTKPLCIADIGHNEAGIRMNMNQLKLISYNKLHVVLGVVNDKDIDKMLALLPKKAQYYFCKANIPRGLKAGVLKNKAKQYGLIGKCYSSVKNAYKNAKKNADKNDLIFIGGSAFTVAEVI